MIKNIIFDWSGVISDEVVLVHKAIMEMFKRLQVAEMSLEEFKENWEQPYMLFYRKYGMFCGPDEEKNLKEEQALYKECYNSALAKYPRECFAGMRDLLFNLRGAGIRMIVLSSNHREHLESDMEEFGLRGIFEEVNDNVHDKADSIKEILERNDFEPEKTLFVGDTTHEVEAGKSAGVKTCAVTWGFSPEEKLRKAGPDFLVSSPKELESIIL
jgi:HAD superfamily hydrolase (TIGR01509 family)